MLQVWLMVRERKIPPMGGDGWWVYRSDTLRDLFHYEHPATIGLDPADAMEAVLIANREANSDPAYWPEVFG